MGKGVAQGILSLANAANSHRGSGKCTSAAILANQMQRNPNPLYTPALLSLPPSHPSIPSSTSFCSPNAPAAVVRKVRKLRNAPSSIYSQAATRKPQCLSTLKQQGTSAAQASRCSVLALARANAYISTPPKYGSPHPQPTKVNTGRHACTHSPASSDHTLSVSHLLQQRQFSCKHNYQQNH